MSTVPVKETTPLKALLVRLVVVPTKGSVAEKARRKIREEAVDPANETAPERAREVRLATDPEKESVAARERDRRLRTAPTNDSEPASALPVRLL